MPSKDVVDEAVTLLNAMADASWVAISWLADSLDVSPDAQILATVASYCVGLWFKTLKGDFAFPSRPTVYLHAAIMLEEGWRPGDTVVRVAQG
jgi:hypothetical protein